MANLSWEDRGKQRWILLEGEMDHIGCGELARELHDAAGSAPGGVVVDLAGVTFIGSHGLRLLLQTSIRLKKAERTLHLHGARPGVRRVLKTIGIFDAISELED